MNLIVDAVYISGSEYKFKGIVSPAYILLLNIKNKKMLTVFYFLMISKKLGVTVPIDKTHAY